MIEGGSGTLVKSDQVCAAITAIALRTGVTNAILTGNDIGCHPRSALSLGPSTPGTVISGNTLSGARLGIVVSDSGWVRVDNNLVTGATVFGLTARGAGSTIKGVGNVISGTGVRAVDTRAGASTPALIRTDTSGWAYHGQVTFFSYLRFHPLAALWLGISVLILVAAAWSYRQRLPDHPYPASTRWRGPARPARNRAWPWTRARAARTRPFSRPGWWPPGRSDRPPRPGRGRRAGTERTARSSGWRRSPGHSPPWRGRSRPWRGPRWP